MKKGNGRTVKKYINKNGSRSTKFSIEVRFNGIWRQAIDPDDKKELIFDLEYDACARLLAEIEKALHRSESF